MHVKVGDLGDEEPTNAVDGSVAGPCAESEPQNTEQMVQNQGKVRQSVINAGKQVIDAVGQREKNNESLKVCVRLASF